MESPVVVRSGALYDESPIAARAPGASGYVRSAFSFVYWKLWKGWMHLRLAGRKTLIMLGRRPSGFRFDGAEHRYFWHEYNLTWLNERAVEIPIAWKHVKEHQGRRILEVGNVLSHYLPTTHEVVDKYERSSGVVNEDIVSFRPEGKLYDLIVSVSTLEHVGWDEKPREPEKIVKAIDNLRSLLAPGGLLVLTVPIGYNEFMDARLRDGGLRFGSQRYLRRVTSDDRWTEITEPGMPVAKYGAPFPFANVVMIATERRPA